MMKKAKILIDNQDDLQKIIDGKIYQIGGMIKQT